jgi:uncharacterized small protein (DUF1192 family)
MSLKVHCGRVVAVALLLATTTQAAQAGFVSTQQAHAVVERQAMLTRVEAKLARDHVRAALQQLGVSEAEVDARVAALTDAELARVDAQLDRLPAGGDALAVIGIVFVVLIILELVGAINLFNEGALNFGAKPASNTAGNARSESGAAPPAAGAL